MPPRAACAAAVSSLLVAPSPGPISGPAGRQVWASWGAACNREGQQAHRDLQKVGHGLS